MKSPMRQQKGFVVAQMSVPTEWASRIVVLKLLRLACAVLMLLPLVLTNETVVVALAMDYSEAAATDRGFLEALQKS